MRGLKLLRRFWLPLVVVCVLLVSAYAVIQLRGAFGSQTRPSYTRSGETAAAPSKKLVYEVFGPQGTVADISYFDLDNTPQEVRGAELPWTLTLTSTSSAVIGSVVAQGNSNSIGCRILVDDQVRVEKVSNQVSAFTNCVVNGA